MDGYYILNSNLRIRRDGCRYVLWPSLPLAKGITFFHRFLRLEEAVFFFLFSKGAKLEGAGKFLKILGLEIKSPLITNFLKNANSSLPEAPGLQILVPVSMNTSLARDDLQTFLGENEPKIELWHWSRVSFPLSVIHDLTYKCEGNCNYCYAPKNKRTPFIPLDTLVERIKEWTKGGVSDVTLTGGDIFLHPRIKDIVEAYIETPMELAVSVKSGFPPWFLEIAKTNNRIYLQVSLDTLPGRTAQKLYNDPAFPLKALNTIDELERNKIGYQIHSVVARENKDSVLDLVNNILSKHPENIIRWAFSSAARSGQRKRPYRPPTAQQMIKLEKELDEIAIKAGFPFNINLGEARSYSMDNFLKRACCSGNRTAMVVLPSGLVTLCEELYENPLFVMGDLRKNTTKEIWLGNRAKELFFVNDKRLLKGLCLSCDNRERCLVELGKCWKFAIRAYGENRPYMPQPDCPFAPKGRKIDPFS